MDFKLNEEQMQIKELVKEFCKREIDPKRIKDIEEKVFNAHTCDEVREVFPWDLLDKLHEVGLRQYAVPEKYGGTGPDYGGNITRLVAESEMGYHAGAAAVLLATPYMYAKAAVPSPYVSEEQKEHFFADFLGNPRWWVAGTVSEPSGGVDPHLPYEEPGVGLNDVFAYKDGGEWVINGNKMFCSGGAVADSIGMLCRTDKKATLTKSATFFIVPRNTPGLSQILNRFVGIELCGNAQTFFDNVRVPDSAIMGEANEGWYPCIYGAMMYKWLMLAPFLGEIQRVYDEVVEYAKQRVQGGKPIIHHSNIAAMLGEAAANIEALRAFAYRTAWETDQWEEHGGEPNEFWCLGYLYLFKKIGLRLSEIANEIYGGVGKSLDMPLEKFARRIFTWQAAGTPTAINAIKCSMAYNHT